MVGNKLRVAQLGNSHALAIAEAFAGFQSETVTVSSLPVFHDWEAVSCPAGGPTQTITIVPAQQPPMQIVLDLFDLYVVSAAGWWACRNEHLRKSGPAHPLAFSRCSHWRPVEGVVPEYIKIISRDVFDDMVYRWISGHHIAQLVRFLALEAQKKIIWVSWPPPSRSLLTDRDWLLNVWYGEQAHEVWCDYRSAEQRGVRRLTAEYGNNVTLLPAPRNEMEEEGFIDEELADLDPFHANVSYGSLVVEQLESRMS